MRLTEAELATMRAEHVNDRRLVVPACAKCGMRWPCAAAKLLAHFAPGPVPHLAGVAMGLFGPVDQSELPPVPASYPPSNRQGSD